MKRHFLVLVALLIATATFAPLAAEAKPFELPTAIAEQIQSFKASADPSLHEAAARKEAFIQELANIEFADLKTAVSRTDLDIKTLSFLKANSAGLITLNEMKDLPQGVRAFSLGLSAQEGIYEMLSERYDLIAWTEAYPMFKIDWHKVKNHTEVFLGKVQKTGAPVFFFLPNKTITYKKPSVTGDEFRWYLADAKRMKNVVFVFGAYDVIDQTMVEAREKANFSKEEFRALFMRAIGAASSNYDNAI